MGGIVKIVLKIWKIHSSFTSSIWSRKYLGSKDIFKSGNFLDPLLHTPVVLSLISSTVKTFYAIMPNSKLNILMTNYEQQNQHLKLHLGNHFSPTDMLKSCIPASRSHSPSTVSNLLSWWGTWQAWCLLLCPRYCLASQFRVFGWEVYQLLKWQLCNAVVYGIIWIYKQVIKSEWIDVS